MTAGLRPVWSTLGGRVMVVDGRPDPRTGAERFDVLLDGRATVHGAGLRRDLAYAHAEWIAETLGAEAVAS